MKSIESFFKKKKGRSYDPDMFRNDKRYKADIQQYAAILNNLTSFISGEEKDIFYLDYFIDLLRKEIKYSALMEINRGNEKFRYLYPFDRLSFSLIREEPQEEIEIDIAENNLISAPWKHARYQPLYEKMKNEDFVFHPTNHFSIYYDYLNVTCVYNGCQSLGLGSYFGKGKIVSRRFKTSKIFDYVDVTEDLAVVYNRENILKRYKEEGEEPPYEFEKFSHDRHYGTDYRLLLIYTLSQMKYKKMRSIKENEREDKENEKEKK